MLAERPGRHREHVFVFPIEPGATDNRVAAALDHVIVRAATAPVLLRAPAGAQHLDEARDRRHGGSAGYRVRVFEDDTVERAAGVFGRQALERGASLRHWVVPQRRVARGRRGLPGRPQAPVAIPREGRASTLADGLGLPVVLLVE